MRILTLFLSYVLIFLVLVSCNDTGTENKETEALAASDQVINPLVQINQMIDADNNDDQLYIKRAKYYLSINEVDSAFRDIFVAIDINDKDAGHFITLSDAYLVLGNPDKCKESLDKALAIDPSNIIAHQKLAELYLIVRDYENTYKTLNKALQLDSYNPSAYYIRGLAQLEQADSLAAIDAFKMTVYQDQDFFDAYFQLGLIYSAMRNPLAIEYFNTAINLQAENIHPYYNLGLYYQENGHIDKALANYQMILEIQPDEVNTLYNLGYVNLVYIQDFEKAVDYFSRAIEVAPTYAEAYYNRAYTYEMIGNINMAVADYRKTLAIKTNYTKAIEALNRLD